MNKNSIMYILVFATLLASIWGSIANRAKIDLEAQLESVTAEMEKLSAMTSKEREQVLGKTAGLQETLVQKDEQLDKQRKELVALRKETKALEAQISGCNASLVQLQKERDELLARLDGTDEPEGPAGRNGSAAEEEPAASEMVAEQLRSVELTADDLRQNLDAANAQIIGLEKILDQKSDALEEAAQEMDRLRINMDVLLSKIADQRDALQELRDENRELVKELAVRNEELADLEEQLIRRPVQE